MHAADQRAGLRERAAATAPGGVLLLQFHTLAAIVADGGWNALRHGHFAYYATPVLARMLDELGFEVTHGFLFDLYGGTVLLAARRRGADGRATRRRCSRSVERETRPRRHRPGGRRRASRTPPRRSAEDLRAHLEGSRDAGRAVLGYAAASRAVPLLNRAGDRARPAPGGRRRLARQAGPPPARASGSRSWRPRRSPSVAPDEVVLFVTDMLAEMRRRMPGGRGGRRPLGDRRPRPCGWCRPPGEAGSVKQGQAGLVVAAKSPAHWRPTASQR